jgi:prepilin signal peptidase PulO-like enzyme (type II secretory pathway)
MLIVFGLCLGSFVNALIWRLHEQADLQAKKKPTKKEQERLKRLSISKGRSMCLSCGHELAGKDLIPILSWLSLRGKCRYCGARIPDTPLAELLVPLVLVLSYLWWPLVFNGFWHQLTFVIWSACMVLFVALALYDLRWFMLPDKLTYPLAGLALMFTVVRLIASHGGIADIGGPLLGVVVIAGLFYGLFVLSEGNWIGGGDVKLGVALGLLAGSGLNGLLVVMFASVIGLLVSLPQLARGKATATSKIPFGPFLLLATFVTVLFGNSLVDWYTDLFL